MSKRNLIVWLVMGLCWMVYAIATTASPKAIAVPITVAAKLGSADVHDKLTAVPQPMRTNTIVPIISAMYFFIIIYFKIRG